jgi:hypothetical protein
MSQQGKDKFGPIAAVPLLGPNAGSSQASTDPLSPQSIGGLALKQQIQATADTRYDPDVPPPVEKFKNPHSPLPLNPESASMGVALLLVALVLIHSCLK